MEHGPSSKATQEMLSRLYKTNIHCRVHKSLSLEHILYQVNPVRKFSTYFFIVH
jgi:hypothetical protein